LGLFSKAGQVLKGFEKGFLNCFLGIFCIMRDALRYSEKLAVLSLHELLESRHVAILGGADEFQVIVCNCCSCELCRVFGHILLSNFGE